MDENVILVNSVGPFLLDFAQSLKLMIIGTVINQVCVTLYIFWGDVSRFFYWFWKLQLSFFNGPFKVVDSKILTKRPMVRSIPIEAYQVLNFFKRFCEQPMTYILTFKADSKLQFRLISALFDLSRKLPQLIFIQS